MNISAIKIFEFGDGTVELLFSKSPETAFKSNPEQKTSPLAFSSSALISLLKEAYWKVNANSLII